MAGKELEQRMAQLRAEVARRSAPGGAEIKAPEYDSDSSDEDVMEIIDQSDDGTLAAAPGAHTSSSSSSSSSSSTSATSSSSSKAIVSKEQKKKRSTKAAAAGRTDAGARRSSTSRKSKKPQTNGLNFSEAEYDDTPQLGWLPDQYRVDRAQVGMLALFAGTPLFVGEIMAMNVFDHDEVDWNKAVELVQLKWFIPSVKSRLFDSWVMEPNEQWAEDQKRKASQRDITSSSSSSSSRKRTVNCAKPPAVLSSKYWSISTLPRWSAYCVFHWNNKNTIPDEVVGWIRKYTSIFDDWDGEGEE